MKTWLLEGGYGLENVVMKDIPQPQLRPNEVLIKVYALSLNQVDLLVINGIYQTTLPHQLGSNAAGIVVATGDDVTCFRKDDQVVTLYSQTWESGPLQERDIRSRTGVFRPGVYAEYIAVPEEALLPIPETLTMEEASTLPIAAVTAWESLVGMGKLKAGQTVLLQGTGGVSVFALQFAKAMGAKVIITSGSDHKLEKMKELGADYTLNYRMQSDWVQQVVELTQGKGVDLAIEGVGIGLNNTMKAMKLNGRISVIGFMKGREAKMDILTLIQKRLTIKAIQGASSKEAFREMNRAIDANEIKPLIDKRYPFVQLKEALTQLQSGNHVGKIVVTI